MLLQKYWIPLWIVSIVKKNLEVDSGGNSRTILLEIFKRKSKGTGKLQILEESKKDSRGEKRRECHIFDKTGWLGNMRKVCYPLKGVISSPISIP